MADNQRLFAIQRAPPYRSSLGIDRRHSGKKSYSSKSYQIETHESMPKLSQASTKSSAPLAMFCHTITSDMKKVFISLSLVLFSLPSMAQNYDLLLKGGHLIDPKNNINGRRDVAITDGKIAAVSSNIPANQAKKVIDVSRFYITPGLVDIHVHVFAGTTGTDLAGGLASLIPDHHLFQTGVTTAVDAGSSGYKNFPEFRDRIIKHSKAKIYALLNIGANGMGGTSNEQDVSSMDAKATAAAALENKDIVVGIKTAHFAGPEWTPVERAVEAGTLANIPIMVDFGLIVPGRPIDKLFLEKMRPGDIYTHMYRPFDPFLDDKGIVQSFYQAARKRGIIFDVGHGAGSLAFQWAVPAMKQGFGPDSISTDLHSGSVTGGMKSMLTVMSKFLNMGMGLEEVIRKSTWNPAREIHREQHGHLTVGAEADIAVLRLDQGKFGFTDVENDRMDGTQKLECELTLRAGRTVWDLNGITSQDWKKRGRTLPRKQVY